MLYNLMGCGRRYFCKQSMVSDFRYYALTQYRAAQLQYKLLDAFTGLLSFRSGITKPQLDFKVNMTITGLL